MLFWKSGPYLKTWQNNSILRVWAGCMCWYFGKSKKREAARAEDNDHADNGEWSLVNEAGYVQCCRLFLCTLCHTHLTNPVLYVVQNLAMNKFGKFPFFCWCMCVWAYVWMNRLFMYESDINTWFPTLIKHCHRAQFLKRHSLFHRNNTPFLFHQPLSTQVRFPSVALRRHEHGINESQPLACSVEESGKGWWDKSNTITLFYMNIQGWQWTKLSYVDSILTDWSIHSEKQMFSLPRHATFISR